MGALGTAEEVAAFVQAIAKDVSVLAPPEISVVAVAIEEAALVVAMILKALESGSTVDSLVSVVEKEMKAASDAQMRAELKG